MKQSPLPHTIESKLHLAIIMDGNGRWATGRGEARLAGHRAGAQNVRRIVEAAPALNVGVLTLYAFSTDNWRRPSLEVKALMGHLEDYLCAERGRCVKHGIRLSVIGRRERLPESLRAAIEMAEAATAKGRNLHLRLAVDYSARDAILDAAQRLRTSGDVARASGVSRETFAHALNGSNRSGETVPDVDLLVRTGGERRLSDFLLWECAYAELYFTDRMWPDFGADELRAAVGEFHARERRFGQVPEALAV